MEDAWRRDCAGWDDRSVMAEFAGGSSLDRWEDEEEKERMKGRCNIGGTI